MTPQASQLENSMTRPTSIMAIAGLLFWTSVWTVTAVAEDKESKAVTVSSASVSTTAEVDSDEAAKVLSGDSPVELSVGPLSLVEYPADRPDWIDAGDSEHRFVVTSGICDDADVATAKRDLLIAATVRSYARGVVNVMPGEFDPLKMDENGKPQLASYIKRQYSGSVQQGDSTMYESVSEISFDSEAREQFQSAAEQVEVGHRLAAMGVCLVGGFGLLVTTSGVLNLASRRKRKR